MDAPERTEEQAQEKENGEAEKESEIPPPEGDKPEGEGEKDAGEGQDSSRQPPDPPEPPDPDEPSNPDDDEDEEGEGDEGAQKEGGEEEEKEEDELIEVESASTRKKRKLSQRKEKVTEAAMQRLPYFLAEGEPMYRGVDAPAKDKPRVNTQWSIRKGSIALAKDTTPIDHNGNRAFENIRDHQISSIFALQKHLADCNKGNIEKNSTPGPLRANNGEYSPCKTDMTVSQMMRAIGNMNIQNCLAYYLCDMG